MTRLRSRILTLAAASAAAFALATSPALAGDSTDTWLALAAPLAEQFGVPSASVTQLIKDGVSIESVAQLLLVTDTSKASLDEVTKLYQESSNDVAAVAKELEVAASAYSKDKVEAVIADAQKQLQAEATDAVADEANKAIGNALGGFSR